MWLNDVLNFGWKIIVASSAFLWNVLLVILLFIQNHWLLLLIFSGISLILTLIGCAALITFLPPDYFHVTNQGRHIKNPILRFIVFILKNLVGALLIVVGALLAVPGVPGQGLLTILTGLIISDFPGKKRLARRIIRIKTVLFAANMIRNNFKRPPLIFEDKFENTHSINKNKKNTHL